MYPKNKMMNDGYAKENMENIRHQTLQTHQNHHMM